MAGNSDFWSQRNVTHRNKLLVKPAVYKFHRLRPALLMVALDIVKASGTYHTTHLTVVESSGAEQTAMILYCICCLSHTATRQLLNYPLFLLENTQSKAGRFNGD